MPAYTALFEGHPIRRIYDEATDTWWFSVVDIIQILTQQPDSRRAGTYWKVLKNRLKTEGSQLVTNCNQLKMTATDGRERLTDCAPPETLLRLVQSVPSPKAEPGCYLRPTGLLRPVTAVSGSRDPEWLPRSGSGMVSSSAVQLCSPRRS